MNVASCEDDAGMIHGDEIALAALEGVGESRLLTCLLVGGIGDADNAGGGNDFLGWSLLSSVINHFHTRLRTMNGRQLTQRRRCERLSLSAFLRSNFLLYNADFMMILRLRSESFKVPIEKSLALFRGWQ